MPTNPINPAKQYYTADIMIDIETAGLSPGCAILQIGAVTIFDAFDLATFPPLNEHISTYSNEEFNLTFEPATLDWWSKQDLELKNKVFGAVGGLVPALTALHTYIGAVRGRATNVRIWAKPARFDIPILEHAYKVTNLSVPWNHKEVMCARTIFELYKKVVTEDPFIGAKHDALDDAMHQAKWLAKVLFEHNGY